jgi:hypothetical protein
LRLCRDEFADEGAFSLLLLLVLVLAEVDGVLLLLLVEGPACECFTRGMLTPASRQKACGNI